MFSRKRVYLDVAAAAPVSKRSVRAFEAALLFSGNPSAPHAEGKIAKELLEQSRQMIAKQVGVKKEAVIFTGTATEANGIALLGYVRSFYASRKPEDIHVLYSPVSHSSVIEDMEILKNEGCVVEALVITDSAIDLEQVKTQLRKETVVVSCDLICGETGTRFKTRDIRRILDASASEALLHIDASQAPLVESVELQHVGADLLTFDAQKIGGVRGIGVLVVARSTPLVPLYGGGGQERGIRSGTPSPALAYACAVALEEAEKERNTFIRHTTALRRALLTELEKNNIEYVVNGGEDTVPHIVNLSLLGCDTDYLVALLNEYGFAVSTKSSCETNSIGSRVVLAFTHDTERAMTTLRISFDQSIRESDIRRFVGALERALRLMKRV